MFINYVQQAIQNTGAVFTRKELKDILNHCQNDLPINGTKGQYGAIFFYDAPQLGVHDDDTLSTGIIAIDVDYISKEVADEIFNYTELLKDDFPSIISIQYSASYFNPNTEKNGLHIYIKSNPLTKQEYKLYAQLCCVKFAMVVYNDLGIDLINMKPNDNGTAVLDMHQTNMLQRFNLFYSPYKYYNEFAVEFNIDIFSSEELQFISKRFNISLDIDNSKSFAPMLNTNVNVGDVKGKIKIDRNFYIGNLCGNEVRYRISFIADVLFGDAAKDFCDRFFYYENNKSIYTKYDKEKVINHMIYNWLVDNGYIIEENKNFIKEWLTEYKTDIVKEIKSNNWLEIVAPTGTGKTTFINTYLAKQFNSVVIVPFNVTNKLYDNLFEVNSLYGGDIPAKKPIVMVWDQAVKHWGNIKDRHLIIDEAHTLFFDRTYRDKAIQLLNLIKMDKPHTTFMTATPAGEAELLGVKQIFYYKKRDIIKVNINATQSVEWSQFNYIKKAIDNNWYDKIVLLDDSTAKKIYEKFIVDGYGHLISYIRSETKYTDDFISLQENELLNKKLTICTCIAFNGLNFKNENEKILVVGSIRQGITTACEMIQQVGRIRKSNVTGLYFYNPNMNYIDDVDEKIKRAEEYHNIYIAGCPDTLLSYNRKYLDEFYTEAIKSINDYLLKHSDIKTIIKELTNTGYIKGKWNNKTSDDKTIKMTCALKRKESNELKADIMNDNFIMNEYDTDYKKEWQEEINYLLSTPKYIGITIELFKDIIEKGADNKLVETIIHNIKEILRYISIDNETFDMLIMNKQKYSNMLSNDVDRRDFANSIKRAINIRNKYMDKIKLNNEQICVTDVLFDVIEEEAKNQMNRNEGRVKGGQKTKEVTINGITYKSVTEAAEKLGISRQALYKRMKQQ